MKNIKINKIILIQFRTDESRADERKSISRYLFTNKNKLEIVSAFSKSNYFSHPEKTINKYDKIILGGSGQYSFSKDYKKTPNNQFCQMISRVGKMIEYLLKNDIDTLGICFGHQLLGHFLGSKIINDKKQEEVGSSHISLTKQGKLDQIFKELPGKFYVQEGHQDSLDKLPEKTVLLATSKACKIQAFRYKKNIYAVQFHPELSVNDILKKLKLYSDYSKDKDVSQIIRMLRKTPHAPDVIKNFIKK